MTRASGAQAHDDAQAESGPGVIAIEARPPAPPALHARRRFATRFCIGGAWEARFCVGGAEMRHHAAPLSCTHKVVAAVLAAALCCAGCWRLICLCSWSSPPPHPRPPARPPARPPVPAPRRFPARAAARFQAAPPPRRQENRAGKRGQHGAAPFRLRRGPCRQAATLRGLRGPAAAGRPLRGPTARPGSSTRAYRRRAHIARPQDAHLPPPEAYYPGPPPPS